MSREWELQQLLAAYAGLIVKSAPAMQRAVAPRVAEIAAELAGLSKQHKE